MIPFFTVIHTLCCLLLIAAILMQSGRGGGLTESFAPAESMFGAKTNEFMVRTTVIFALVFLVTSLSLARFSAKKEESLIPETVASQEKDKIVTTDEAAEKEEIPEPEAASNIDTGLQ